MKVVVSELEKGLYGNTYRCNYVSHLIVNLRATALEHT